MVVKKVDVKNEISWKNGIFSFNGKPLKDIMKVISRWYNVDVVFKNKELENIEFVGIIKKDQSIEYILSIMQSTSIIHYDLSNRTITLE
jgi:ferric-dicitrate binding protein FerR (iron transport regulator)